jgi:hypothetical protein
LCDQELESAAHLSLPCSSVKEVWANFQNDNASLVSVVGQANSVRRWWRKMQVCVLKSQRPDNIKLAAYITWNIWKERGRRVFQGKELNASSLAQIIRDELAVVSAAFFALSVG